VPRVGSLNSCAAFLLFFMPQLRLFFIQRTPRLMPENSANLGALD
jgi:hypothetical protein